MTEKKKKAAKMKPVTSKEIEAPAKLIAHIADTKADTVYKKRNGKRPTGKVARRIELAEGLFNNFIIQAKSEINANNNK